MRSAGRNGSVCVRSDLRAGAGWSAGGFSVQVLDAHRPGRRRAGQDRKLHRHPESELRLSQGRHRQENLRQPRSFARPAGLPHGDPDRESGWHARLAPQVRAGQPDQCHLGRPRRCSDGGTHGERQHHLQLHLARHEERSAGRGDSARGLGRRERFLVSLGRRCGHYRRGSGQRRQVPRSTARLQGRGPSGLCGPAAEHVWQLAFLSRLPRRWLHEARRRVGQEAPEDLSAFGGRESSIGQVHQCLGRSLELLSRPATTRSGNF